VKRREEKRREEKRREEKRREELLETAISKFVLPTIFLRSFRNCVF
jgi:hypothetical protein